MSFAYMRFFTGDYYRDTRHLSMLQHGAYRQLLDHCWDQKGPLPLDVTKCYRICGAVSKEEQECVQGIVAEFFTKMEDGHYNKRMTEEIRASEAISQGRADAGKAGGLAKAAANDRALKDRLANAKQMLANAKQMPVAPASALASTPSPASRPGGAPPDPPLATLASGGPAKKTAGRPVAKSAVAWDAYAGAYKSRYGVEPVRNAKVNSHFSQLVDRLGINDAPQVAEFYLSHRNSLYVSAKHCTDLLVRDAEKLRTEWATGNVGYRREAVEEDRSASKVNAAERIAQKLTEKGFQP